MTVNSFVSVIVEMDVEVKIIVFNRPISHVQINLASAISSP